MGACTLPKALGIKAWFDARFDDCCQWHDERYVARDCLKIQADFGVAVRIARKRRRYIPLGIAAFVVLTISPAAYIMWVTDE